MAEDPATTLYQIGLLILVSSIAAEAFKRIGLPGLIGAILVGLFIGGPGGIGLVTDLTVINIMAALGAVLILFTAGLEFEASAFWTVGRRAFALTTSGFLVSLFVGYLIGSWLGWTEQSALLLGAVIAPSGTSVIATTLTLAGLLDTKGGSTLLTAAVIDDVEGVLLLTIVLGSAGGRTLAPAGILWLALISSAFILITIYVGSRVFPLLISRFAKFVSDEVLITILLGSGLILAFSASRVGLATVTGAFIMGVVIPYRKIGEKVAHKLLPMKEIFAAIFFTSIGLQINPYAIPGVLPIALIVLASAIGARIIGGSIGGIGGRFHRGSVLALATALAIRAEMSLIIAQAAVSAGVANNEFLALSTTIVIGSIITVLPVFSRLSRWLV